MQEHDTTTPAGRLAFLNAMLAVAASIPEAAARDQFADRLSLRAGISEDVVRDEIRKAAVARKTTAPAPRPVSRAQLTEAERDLLTHLMSTPAEAADAVTDLEPADLVGLAARAAARVGAGPGPGRTDPGAVRLGGLPAPVGAGRGRRGVPDRAVGDGREAGPGGRLHSGPQGAAGDAGTAGNSASD